MKICISLAFVCLAVWTNSVNSLLLADNGGYNIVIAVKENTPVPNIGVETYQDNIKKTLQVLSNQLWRATDGTFFINSADLLVPSSWETSALDGDAVGQSFSTADIRLSDSIPYPYAENSHPCGKAGEFIGLPDTFFNVSNAGPYGPSWKALLNLWARFRWGVWDEHGYIGASQTASRFSYSYKPVGAENWVVTGCSDAPLEGTFVNHIDNDVICPTNNTLVPPSQECRFKPDAAQTATTSLMHFHWLDSVDSFCDQTNHNRAAPNKQNFYCNHRSIKEVMASTSDHAAVTNPSTSVPTLTFKTVRSSRKPLLYVLLDRGSIEGSMSIATKMPPGLIPLFTSVNTQAGIAALGTYPGNVSEGSYVREEVPWSLIGPNQDLFLSKLGHLSVDGEPKRDFGLAIKEVIEKIKIKSPTHGAIILVVKYGSAGPIEEASFADITPEAEVIAELRDNSIMLASIELGNLNNDIRPHLPRAARESGGLYTTLQTAGESDGQISQVVSFVTNLFRWEEETVSSNRKTIIKRRTVANSITYIPVPNGLNSNLQVFYTSPANLTATEFRLRNAATNTSVGFLMTKTFDWNEETDTGKRYSYTLTIQRNSLTDVTGLDFEVLCPNEEQEQCTGNIFANAQFDGAVAENLEIILSTSSTSQTVDLTAERVPFAIFAKVTKNYRPISNAVVSAVISQTGTNTSYNVQLEDNGLGGPDVEKGDGIYSSYFIPREDGSYSVSVYVRNGIIPDPVPSTGFVGRLLPIDQEDFGCDSGSCVETIQGSFGQSLDYPAPFAFTGAQQFQNSPSKITDFRYTVAGSSGYLHWTSPTIPGNDLDKASMMEIRQSNNLDTLINDFGNCSLVAEPRPAGPGEGQTQPIEIPTDIITYFAIRSFYYNEGQSEISNVVMVENLEATPTTLTPTTPTTTTTTTIPPSPTTPTTTPTTTTTTEHPGSNDTTEKDDPWIQTTTGIIVVIIIILAVIAVAGFGYWYFRRRNSATFGKSNSKEVLAVRATQPEQTA